MIRQIIVDEVKRSLPDRECAVLLSGGVDSISVAFAADILGKKITAYSFYLCGNPTYDYKKAQEICDLMNWDFVGVEVPVDNLIDDFHKLVKLGCKKKTHFECVFPFLYVYPKIQERCVLSGWAADGYYGLSQKAVRHYKHTKEKFDEFRNKYFLPEERAGYNWHIKVAEKYDKDFITPYLCPAVSDFFYALDWYEINKPKQKHHIRNAFADGFSKIGKIKPHINLQAGADIPTLFEGLLVNDEINYKNRTRMMDVYKDWWKNNQISTLEDFL